MTNKTRSATLTHPTTGETFTANYGTKYKFVRFMLTSSENGGPISKHATLDQAISGPSQTTAWNTYPRVVVDIDSGEIVFDGRPCPESEEPHVERFAEHVDNCGCRQNGDGFYTFRNTECVVLKKSLVSV